jgi:hypothetical protein
MKTFIKCAVIRAIKTMCQTAIGIIGASKLISDVDWITCLSAVGMAGILSILTSIVGGLPEVDYEEEDEEDEEYMEDELC